MDGLEGKVVVFAGGGGIAQATAEILGAGGAKVIVGDIDADSAEAVVQAAKSAGGEGLAVTVDIADQEQVRKHMELAVREYGRIDGLFNVAANIGPDEVAKDTHAVDIDLSAWQRSIDVNLTSYLLTLERALPHMITGGGGSVVNILSAAAYAGMPDKVAYSVTKAGLTALTRQVAGKYGKHGIRANGVAPGRALTEQTKLNLPSEYQDVALRATPSPRHGEPEDIGSMVAFLLSDRSAWINGQMFSVGGGSTMCP
ncbi:SDR family NAD(P)-dependent oxidoreductase [Streptomyces sp. TG1A-60]|uniref:SDR family NAD(P)-dependent oxidoreductase n=1 Tax=Streptomyces sp. TG1A-60 TaxID=3129111 RepID=UPI0030D0FBEF